jgi:hypothetical protein
MRVMTIVSCAALALVVGEARAMAQVTLTWDNLGESLNGASLLSVAKMTDTDGHQKITVYGVDHNQHVKMRELDTQNGLWTRAWSDIGCCIINSTTAAEWPGNRYVFGLGTDNKLYFSKSVNFGAYSGWAQLDHPSHLQWCGSPYP